MAGSEVQGLGGSPELPRVLYSTALLVTFASLEKEGAIMTEQQLEKREKVLRTAMERTLPEFVRHAKKLATRSSFIKMHSAQTTTNMNCWGWLSSSRDYMGKNSTSSVKTGKR
jgi:hypothetical protein